MPKHNFISERAIDEIRPSPENDRLYRPVDLDDPEIIALADSIFEHGVREPLVVTLDGWIVSGHRRHAAARLAGLKTVPCRIEAIRRGDDIDQFVKLLREYNRQRDKTFVARHGRQVFEVEALAPAQLQDELRRAIDAAIDVPAFNAELDREKQDAAYLSGVRTTVNKTLQGLG